MSELPDGWANARLPDLVAANGVFVDGDWVESKDQDPKGDVRLVQLADIGDGWFVDKSNRSLTQEKAQELRCTFLAQGDVLIARMPDPLGRACLFPGGKREAVTVVDVCIVRGNPEHFDNTWLMHFINSAPFRADIHSLQSGSTRKRISRGNLGTLNLPVPPRAEQTRIVAKLEELLSDLDAGVAELKAAQKKQVQYRQSLLKAAVEGELTAEWRANNTSAETGAQLLERILIERRARWEAKQLAKFVEQGKTPPKEWQKKYPEPVQPDTTELPELPEGWAWASVEQLAELVSGHTPKDAAAVSTHDGVVPWFKVGDMNLPGNEEWMSSATVRFSREIAESIGLKIMPTGTIIFPKRGGAIATNKKRKLGVDGCYDLNTMGLVPVKTISDWLWMWFMGVDLGRLVDGAVIPQINNPDIAPLCVPMPPSLEQQEIISVVNVQIEALGIQSNAIESSLKHSAAQRQNILRAAFAGELVPQDPNDEPASVLLERIRAERAELAKQPKALKTKKRKSMNPSKSVSLSDWIKAFQGNEFSFDDLRSEISVDYEALKNSLFELLTDENPAIEQFFDSNSGTLRFRKVK